MPNDNLKNLGYDTDLLRMDAETSGIIGGVLSEDSSTVDLIVSGEITGSELNIPSKDSVLDSFHADNRGNTWWGTTTTGFRDNRDNARAYILSDGRARFKDIDIGFRYKTLSSGDDIQTAINELGSGGVLFLKAGTYTTSSDIVGTSGIQIVGESESTTIIDFGNTASSVKFEGSDVYTTGTISSVAYNGGAGAFEVTGSGTLWLANATAGQYIFLGTRWYKIAAVTSNTTLLLAEGFSDDTPSTYRIATIVEDINISNITIKNSTGAGLKVFDARNVIMNEVVFLTNNVGIDFDNVSLLQADNIQIISSTSDGAQFTNCGLANYNGFLTLSNGGNGVTISNLKTFQFRASSSSSNTGDGINATTFVDGLLEYECAGNGGQGIEIVATSNRLFIQNCLINGNTSDGLKFTATTDNSTISDNQITDNGGYGLNIAAATCDNNIVVANQFDNNTSGDINNSGTGTLFNTNIPHQENFHWLTLFESIDGYAKSADGTGSISLSGAGDWLTIYSGNVTGNVSKIQKDFRTYQDNFLNFASKTKIWTAWVGFQNPVTETEVRIGMGVLEVLTLNHIGFKFTDGVVYGTVADGTTESTVDLNYTYSSNSIIELKFVFTPGKNVEFYISGSYRGEITTNLPSSSTYSYKIFYASLKSTSNALRELWVSMVELWQSAY